MSKGANGTAAGDPAAARLHELSQLAGQLSGEQLQSLMAELGKSGINTSALDDILKREQGQQPPGL